MTKRIMILSEHIPWLMEIKDRIGKVVSGTDESVQFRLSRNLFTASLASADARHEYLYVFLGDMCSKQDLGRQIQYIYSLYPYAKIVGIRKASESLEMPEAGKYAFRKKGILAGNIRVIDEKGLESYFGKELEQLENFAEQVYQLQKIEIQKKEDKKNEQKGIS